MATAQRDLDIVVFGASGDTGVSACCALFFKGQTLGINSWAPAARNLSKLRSEFLDQLADTPPGQHGIAPSEPIQADSGDYASLLSMCRRAKCVVACAGPYSQYGEGVVKACIEAGTHYVDVTGEVPWVEQMEQKYGEEAQKQGVTVVNMAGYDSVPPDLTTFLAAKSMREEGEMLGRFDVFCGGSGGAIPSGTINTMAHGVDEAKNRFWNTVTFGMVGSAPVAQEPKPETTAAVRKYVPETESGTCSSNFLWSMLPGYSSMGRQFAFPHVMAPINIPVVHRTAAVEGYGGLVYRERMGGLPNGALSGFGLVPTVCGTLGFLALGAAMALPYSTTALLKFRDTVNPPLREHVRKRMLDGFSSTGKLFVEGFGVSRSGKTSVTVQLKADYDGGLAFTMLSACTVAGSIVSGMGSGKKPRVGFNTAVTSVGGDTLADALTRAGVELKVTKQKA